MPSSQNLFHQKTVAVSSLFGLSFETNQTEVFSKGGMVPSGMACVVAMMEAVKLITSFTITYTYMGSQ